MHAYSYSSHLPAMADDLYTGLSEMRAAAGGAVIGNKVSGSRSGHHAARTVFSLLSKESVLLRTLSRSCSRPKDLDLTARGAAMPRDALTQHHGSFPAIK